MSISRAALVFAGLALAGVAGCQKDAATLHREKGDELLGSGKFPEAAAEYGLSLEADPKQEKLWEKKAFAYMKAGDLDQAAATIIKTLDFKTELSKKTEVYHNLAGMYLQSGASDKAEQHFLEALKLDPKDEFAVSWLGEIYAQRGGARDMKVAAVPAALDKAIEYYDRAIALNPAQPNSYLNKRIALTKYMAFEKAEKETAEKEAEENSKDKDKAAEAKARAEQHQARMEDLKKKLDELTQSLNALQKKK